MLRAWSLFGLDGATKDYMTSRGIEGEIKNHTETFLNELTGLIAYIHMVLGKENSFYKKVAHEFNVLAKRTQFFVKYDVDELVYNSVFNLTNYDSNDIPQLESVAFYCNGKFFACLHGVYPEGNFEFLRILISRQLKILF